MIAFLSRILQPRAGIKAIQLMNFKRLSFFFFVVTFIISCTSNDSPNGRNTDPDSFYFDYRVTGDEEAGYITIRLQFKVGDPAGPAMMLQKLTEPVNRVDKICQKLHPIVLPKERIARHEED